MNRQLVTMNGTPRLPLPGRALAAVLMLASLAATASAQVQVDWDSSDPVRALQRRLAEQPEPAVVASLEAGDETAKKRMAAVVGSLREMRAFENSGGDPKAGGALDNLAALPAHDSPLVEAPDRSRFHQLAEIYARAARPSKNELLGWFSGRCYRGSQPFSPEEGLLAGILSATDDVDHGPLFPSRSHFKVGIFQHSGSARGAAYFDDMSPEETADVAASIAPIFHSDISIAAEIDGAIASNSSPLRVEYRIRKHGRYFLAAVLPLDKPDSSDKAGEVAMCYFFKKLR